MRSRWIVALLAIALLNLGSPRISQAQLIGTLQVLEAGTRADHLATVHSALSRDQVRAQFIALGVEPTKIESLIAALTDAELQTLAARMSGMPAGADALAVIGIVFLVLLILEAVGVIDIFKKFP